MEAKDTVLPYLQVSNQIPMTLLEFIAKLEDQANVSFKAGYEEAEKEGVDRLNGCKDACALSIKDSRQAGIREVVDAVWNESYGDPRVTGHIHIEWADWQAKLKEWGL